MLELIIIAFIGFCFYKAYTLHKAKKQQKENKAPIAPVAPIRPEPEVQPPPPSDTVQYALYEMQRKQAEEQQAELDRKTATENELANNESARQALKAMNDKKKAESRTPHPGSLIDSWDDEDEWDDDYSDREQCEIHYTDSDGNFSIRDVEPLNVRKNGNGNTILVAVDTDIDELRYFRLDRIELVSYDGKDYTEAREISRILRKLSPECN